MKKSRNTVPVCAGLFYDACVVCNRVILDDMRSTSCTLKDIAEISGDWWIWGSDLHQVIRLGQRVEQTGVALRQHSWPNGEIANLVGVVTDTNKVQTK